MANAQRQVCRTKLLTLGPAVLATWGAQLQADVANARPHGFVQTTAALAGFNIGAGGWPLKAVITCDDDQTEAITGGANAEKASFDRATNMGLSNLEYHEARMFALSPANIATAQLNQVQYINRERAIIQGNALPQPVYDGTVVVARGVAMTAPGNAFLPAANRNVYTAIFNQFHLSEFDYLMSETEFQGFNPEKIFNSMVLKAAAAQPPRNLPADMALLCSLIIQRGPKLSKIIPTLKPHIGTQVLDIKTAYTIFESKPPNPMDISLPRLSIVMCFYVVQCLMRTNFTPVICANLGALYPKELAFPGVGPLMRYHQHLRNLYAYFQKHFSLMVSGGQAISNTKLIAQAKIGLNSSHVPMPDVNTLFSNLGIVDAQGAVTGAFQVVCDNYYATLNLPANVVI